MKFALSLAGVALALIVTAVFLFTLDTMVGKIVVAVGAGLLMSASLRYLDARKRL